MHMLEIALLSVSMCESEAEGVSVTERGVRRRQSERESCACLFLSRFALKSQNETLHFELVS